MKIITTKRQFEEFKKECLRLQEVLNLKDWQIYFEYLKGNDSYGNISINVGNNLATVRLCKSYNSDHPLNLKITAKHEMIHLLLARLEDLTKNRYITKEQIYDENERLARILEKLEF